jgi:hypothetical protein
LISTSLWHSTIAITANTYIHAVEAMQRGHADRIEAILGDAVASGMASAGRPAFEASVPQRCHERTTPTKNARRIRRFDVAPAGFEPALLP